MAGKKKLTERERRVAVPQLVAEGWTIIKIARFFKVHPVTVRNYLKESGFDGKRHLLLLGQRDRLMAQLVGMV